MKKTLTVIAIALMSGIGCENNSPSSPTVMPPAPSVPQVEGTYRGRLTVAGGGTSVYAGEMTARVTQAGNSVTITGSYTAPTGATAGLPSVTGYINASGYFTQTGGGSGSDTAEDPDCGTLRGTGQEISFSGRTMSYWAEISTTWCGLIQFSATLRR